MYVCIYIQTQLKLMMQTCQNYICEHNKKKTNQEKTSGYFKS